MLTDLTIPEDVLIAEQQALATDRDRYLECLVTPLCERRTQQQIRDGLILYWHVYRRIVDPPDKLETFVKPPKCQCPVRCKYCGRTRSWTVDGHYCKTKNCEWQHGYPGCTKRRNDGSR